jgi:hypothetical protein
MATVDASTNLTQMNPPTKAAQIRVGRRSPAYWSVTTDNPPINLMGPEMVKQLQEVMGALEANEHVRVVVFDGALDDYFPACEVSDSRKKPRHPYNPMSVQFNSCEAQ